MATHRLQIPGLDAPLRLAVHRTRDIYISAQIRAHGIWEPFESGLVLSLPGAGDCCVDVGANLGYFTVLAAHAVGAQGKVFAFEPEPDNFSLLQRNLSLNNFQNRCTAENTALTDRQGEGRLFLNAENLGDHQLMGGDGDRDSIPVRLTTGDDYFATRTETVSLVKIDTQGSEYRVVSGMLRTLQKSRNNLKLLVELTPRSLRRAGSSGSALIGLLQSLDLPFAIVDHIEHRLVATPAPALKRWCDTVDQYPDDEGFMNILVGEIPAALYDAP